MTTKRWLEDVHFGDDGLVPVVAHMLASADGDALEQTRSTGEAQVPGEELERRGSTR